MHLPCDEQNAGVAHWYALQTRPKHEKSVSALLEGKGYEQVLPVYQSWHRSSGRMQRVLLPLFKGYLFCRFDPYRRLPILITPGVSSIVGRGREPEPIPTEEVARIQASCASGLEVTPWPYLERGDLVRVECGPLQGVEGIFISEDTLACFSPPTAPPAVPPTSPPSSTTPASTTHSAQPPRASPSTPPSSISTTPGAPAITRSRPASTAARTSSTRLPCRSPASAASTTTPHSARPPTCAAVAAPATTHPTSAPTLSSLPMDTGTAHVATAETDPRTVAGLATLTAPDLPIYQITGCTDPTGKPVVYTTTDPGKALFTGLCADINRTKVPTLRGLASRAPYFHGGTATDLPQLVRFYNARFQMNLTPPNKRT